MTPVEEARKAAVEAVRWSDAEYNPEYVVLAAIDAYEARLKQMGYSLYSDDAIAEIRNEGWEAGYQAAQEG